MKRSLALLVMLASIAFAQTTKPKVDEPTKTGVPMKTWNLRKDGSWQAQYDPNVWKEAADPDAQSNDAFAPTMLILANDHPFVAIRATFGGGGNVTFKDHTTGYINSIKERRDIMILDISGDAGAEKDDAAIFVAYIQEPPDSKQIAFLVSDWIFPGEKNNVDSHSGMLVEGLSPATEVNEKWMDKQGDVVHTLHRVVVPKEN